MGEQPNQGCHFASRGWFVGFGKDRAGSVCDDDGFLRLTAEGITNRPPNLSTIYEWQNRQIIIKEKEQNSKIFENKGERSQTEFNGSAMERN